MLVCGDRARGVLRRLMWCFAELPAAALAPTQVPSLSTLSPKQEANPRKLAEGKTLGMPSKN